MARGKRASSTGREIAVREEPTVASFGRGANQPQRASYAAKPRVSIREDVPPARAGVLRRSVETSIKPPERRLIRGITGRGLETSPYGESILTDRIMVSQLNYPNTPDLYCSQTSLTIYDPVIQFVQQLFPLLTQRVIEKGRFVNGTLTAVDVFRNNMNTYCYAFMALRALESIYAANGINQAYEKMAAAGSQFKIRVEQDLQRVASFPAPQGLVDMMDRMCGVFAPDPTGHSVLAVLDTSVSGGQDLSTSAGWAAVLTQIEGSTLFVTAPTADFVLMYNVLGTLYGIPKIGPKGVSTKWNEYCAQLSQLFVWHDTTAASFWATPSVINGVSGVNQPVPLLSRRGVDFEPWELSLLRPAVFSAAGAQNAVHNPVIPVGFENMSGGVGDQFVTFWDAAGTRTVFDPTGAGQASAGSLLSLAKTGLTWAMSSGSEQGTPQLFGQEIDWDVFTTSQDVLVDETILQYTSIFELAN